MPRTYKPFYRVFDALLKMPMITGQPRVETSMAQGSTATRLFFAPIGITLTAADKENARMLGLQSVAREISAGTVQLKIREHESGTFFVNTGTGLALSRVRLDALLEKKRLRPR